MSRMECGECLARRLTEAPTIGRFELGQSRGLPVHWFGSRCYPCESEACHAGASAEAGKLFLLFLAEFLESGIGAQRVPDRIEP